MEPIKPTAALESKIRVQHEVEPAHGGDAASGTIGDLLLHILEKIFGYIVSPLESVRLAAVCKSWAAAVSEWLARPTPHLFALQVSNEEDRHWFQFRPPPEIEHHRWAIFSLPVQEEESPSPVATARLPYELRRPKGMKLSGALPCGRLSFASESRLVLVNPVTTGVFQSKKYAPFGTGAKVRAVAGTNAIFDHDYSERSVSLFWLTETEEWSQRKLLSQEFKSIYLMAYADGIIYALEFWGCTYTVDTRVPPPWRLMKLHAPSILEQYTPIRGNRFLGYSHLLESEGSVLFVGPVQEPARRNNIGGFEVYRLDVEGARWVKVERLAADRALFVSEQSSFTVRASEVPGCMSNCIYFVDDIDGRYYPGVIWGVYSMEKRKVLFQRPLGAGRSWKNYDAARWFLPAVVIPLACARSHCTLGKKDKNLSFSEGHEDGEQLCEIKMPGRCRR